MNLEHLLNNKKQINSAIIRQKSFQSSTFFQQILKESSQLNIFKNITITDRINFLLEKSNIEFCPKCSKPYFKCNQKTYQLCTHKKKKDIVYTKYSKNRNNTLKVYIENKKYLNDNALTTEFDKFINFYQSHKNYQLKSLFSTNKNLFSYILNKTQTLIPVIHNKLKLNERIYLIHNNLNEIPKCKYCDKPLRFISFFSGYAKCCTAIEKTKLKIDKIFENNKDFIWVNREDFKTLNTSKIEYIHKNCNTKSHIYLYNGRLNLIKKLKCEKCNSQSFVQDTLQMFIESLNFKTIKNYRPEGRGVKGSLECDIFVPDKNIGIEFNGIYWHSFCDKFYHLNKINYFKKFNIQLINIFEDEWMFKKEQVKNKLKEILCHKEKIKNYLIKEVNENEANMFTKCYAINDFKADLHIGTYVNDELISIMSFENINNIWYLTNICSNSLFENNYVKIINYFKSNISKQLFFKCDNCWPLDLHLQKCFKKLNDIEPGVWTLNKNHQKLNYFENDEQIKDLNCNRLYNCGYELLEMK